LTNSFAEYNRKKWSLDMLYVKVKRASYKEGNKILSAVVADRTNIGNRDAYDIEIENRNDWRTLEEAAAVAAALNIEYAHEGRVYIPTDAGGHVSPRYDVIEAPRIGDFVSYAFNGDSYPSGVITKISKTLRRVETEVGDVFYRRRESGSWVKDRTWTMVHGYWSKKNPSF
jgi:hypothetical protein